MKYFLLILWTIIFVGSAVGLVKNFKQARELTKKLKVGGIETEEREKIREKRILCIISASISGIVFAIMMYGLVDACVTFF